MKLNYNREDGDLDFLAIPTQMSNLDPVSYQYFDNLLNHRTIIFNAEVDTDIVESLIMPLRRFEEDDSEEPITLILSTPGGSSFAGLSVCNIIENYKKKLNVVVANYALSMGFYILIAGRNNPNVTRSAYPFSIALAHAGDLNIAGESGSAKDTFDFCESLDNMVKDFVLSHTTISEEEYDKHSRKQWFFTSADMKKYGIIDKIIGVDD